MSVFVGGRGPREDPLIENTVALSLENFLDAYSATYYSVTFQQVRGGSRDVGVPKTGLDDPSKDTLTGKERRSKSLLPPKRRLRLPPVDDPDHTDTSRKVLVTTRPNGGRQRGPGGL